ncbi:hypothetical protein EV122DRAFT_257244 [Schizophyllum commune]
MEAQQTGLTEKQKRTRRRQRVSCSECVHRRQKCDRQSPCSLCVSRGVPHLCHWEPFIKSTATTQRPAPAAPYEREPEIKSTIEQLRNRVLLLEEALQKVNKNDPPSASTRTPSDTYGSPPGSTEGSEPGPAKPYVRPAYEDRLLQKSADSNQHSSEVHEVAIALTHMSMSSGQGEYMGMGSVVCALYRLGSLFPRVKVAESAKVASARSPGPVDLTSTADPTFMFNTNLNSDNRRLTSRLPPKPTCDALLHSYFSHCNWRFGIPEINFMENYDELWRMMDATGGEADVNPHFLSLLFAMLSMAPDDERDDTQRNTEFFRMSISARRLGEDSLLAPAFGETHSNSIAPTADGTVLSCIAAPILAAYLADRGLVSEGWKIVGASMRNAYAIGLNRDPDWDTWRIMKEDEKRWRRRGWWSLVLCDRIYSYILGRPAMVQDDHSDVMPPTIDPKSPPSTFDAYINDFGKLSRIMSYAARSCLTIQSLDYSKVLEIDRLFVEWEQGLSESFIFKDKKPVRYSPSNDPDVSAAANEQTVARQRFTLITWYRSCRMALHRQYLTFPGAEQSRPPPSNSIIADLSSSASRLIKDMCVRLSKDLIRLELSAQGNIVPGYGDRPERLLPGKISGFLDAFFLFDGAVTLMGSLFQLPPDDPMIPECYQYIDHAGYVLGQLAKAIPGDAQCDLARRAVAVLIVLKRGQERLKESRSSSPVPRAPSPAQQHNRSNGTSSPPQPPTFGIPESAVRDDMNFLNMDPYVQQLQSRAFSNPAQSQARNAGADLSQFFPASIPQYTPEDISAVFNGQNMDLGYGVEMDDARLDNSLLQMNAFDILQGMRFDMPSTQMPHMDMFSSI